MNHHQISGSLSFSYSTAYSKFSPSVKIDNYSLDRTTVSIYDSDICVYVRGENKRSAMDSSFIS